MLQDFDSPTETGATTDRLQALRTSFGRLGIDGVLVPRSDEHQGEYVPACAERLAWLTGFTGSAGLTAVLIKSAALLIDGRYTLQARAQVDASAYQMLQMPQQPLTDWIGEQLKRGGVIGFDPKLHTLLEIERLGVALLAKGIKLKALAGNPVDRIWGDGRPAAPAAPVVVHTLAHAGQAAADKIAQVQKALAAAKEDAVVLTLPDSICWLLNIRGSDVAHNPVLLAYAIVPANGRAELFVAGERVAEDTRRHLSGAAELREPALFAPRLTALRQSKAKVRLDPATASWWCWRRLGASKRTVSRGEDPCVLSKARKNEVEIAGARAAHLRDGVAVCRFLAWLDGAVETGLDEIGAAQRLEALRAETGALKDLSFDTISGAGPNGAIVHYRVTRATNRKLKAGELFLIDSGAQYVDGTTDITRTIAVGKPSREMRARFSLVLKGHIAVARARFPKGTRGNELDALARIGLWHAGLDFDHGTGHGIGSYLSVHEGPQSIGKRFSAPLEPGMIVSNEPGFYKEGGYGIRIENLQLVTPLAKIAGGDREMMGFETLTLAPIDRRLVMAEMLNAEELAWLDAYHARVKREIGAKLGKAERAWLNAATAPIGA